jgi:phosphoribosylamine---glycine ligase
VKVLIIGSGAREHALCWKVANSTKVTSVFCAPGNPGMESVATCVNISEIDINGILKFVRSENIDFVIVGPEASLDAGVVDLLKQENIPVFGPTKAASNLESSKAFAKDIMNSAGVTTPKCDFAYSKEEVFSLVKNYPIVLKADQLAKGKGVVICHTEEELISACDYLFLQLKSAKVLVEEFISGPEVSLIVATDGERIVPFPLSNDYKRLYDHNLGPNTGGVGAISPSPFIDENKQNELIDSIFRPVLKELAKRGIPFSGFLYAGLLLDSSGKVYVLEFNTRLGDPESQVLLVRMESDLCQMLYELCLNMPLSESCSWSEKVAICVVLASAGYPETPKVGFPISGLEIIREYENTEVFFAGVKRGTQPKNLITSGGRVLSVVATDSNFEKAKEAVYCAVGKVSFQESHYRTDIGKTNQGS